MREGCRLLQANWGEKSQKLGRRVRQKRPVEAGAKNGCFHMEVGDGMDKILMKRSGGLG